MLDWLPRIELNPADCTTHVFYHCLINGNLFTKNVSPSQIRSSLSHDILDFSEWVWVVVVALFCKVKEATDLSKSIMGQSILNPRDIGARGDCPVCAAAVRTFPDEL